MQSVIAIRMLSMRTENVLFDLDGTLIDSFPGIEYSVRAAISAVTPHCEVADLRQLIGPPVREVLKRAVSGVEPETLDELERQFRVSYDGQGWQQALVYKGVTEVLLQLSQAKVKSFVVTNKPILPTGKILERLGLFKYFVDIVALDSRVPLFSSKAEAVAFLLSKHGLDARVTLFVGDSVDDARAAQLCGLRFVAVTYGYGRLGSQCDLPIHITLDDMSRLASVIGDHHLSQ